MVVVRTIGKIASAGLCHTYSPQLTDWKRRWTYQIRFVTCQTVPVGLRNAR